MVSSSFRKAVIRAGGNRTLLRLVYYLWRAFPYPLRRVVTALFIMAVLFQKRLFCIDRQNDLTPIELLGNLAFWGVPEVELRDYRLNIDGAVEQPVSWSIDAVRALPVVARQVRMDCVGGFRNNSIMEGVPLREVLDRVGVKPEARRAVFHCADGYYAALDLDDLRAQDAFLAFTVNHQALPRFGYPLRLAVPGKYGYQWAKWVVRIELVTDRRKGYWARLGLPDRGNLGDIW